MPALSTTRYSDNVVENAYVDELQNFLTCWPEGTSPTAFGWDRETIRLIETIEEA